MDKDSGPYSRPAGKESRGEVVKARQEIVNQLWTWEKEKTKQKTKDQPSKHDIEQAGKRLGSYQGVKVKALVQWRGKFHTLKL